jgi:hypothetical protein
MISMIMNLIAPTANKSDTLTGIHRSRFSFHFNTAHRRRWLLVQLVSAPAIATDDDTATNPSTTDYSDLRAAAPSVSSLLDNYVTSRAVHCY